MYHPSTIRELAGYSSSTRMILEHSRVLSAKTSTQYPVRTMITMIMIMMLMMMMMTWWWWCSELMAGSRRPALGQRWLLTCYPRVINPHLDSVWFFLVWFAKRKYLVGDFATLHPSQRHIFTSFFEKDNSYFSKVWKIVVTAETGSHVEFLPAV